MTILVDSREQKPFAFQGFKHYADVKLEKATLLIGDYSLPGLTDKIAIERKELADLVQCLGKERDRFERELVKAQGWDCFAVVVEASWEDLAKHNYRGNFNSHAACQSVLAFMGRYCPFHFAGSRLAAEYCVWGLLRQYLESARKRLKIIAKSQDWNKETDAL